MNVFKVWHELEHYFGRGTTGTQAAAFANRSARLVGGPSFGHQAAGCLHKVFLIGQLRVSPTDDMGAIHKPVSLTPLSDYGKTSPTRVETLPPSPDIADHPLGFHIWAQS